MESSFPLTHTVAPRGMDRPEGQGKLQRPLRLSLLFLSRRPPRVQHVPVTDSVHDHLPLRLQLYLRLLDCYAGTRYYVCLFFSILLYLFMYYLII